MAGKSRVTAGEEQRNALLTLAHSRDRGEADRARAILLTLSGWTSPRIAEAFSVREDTVRLWRSELRCAVVGAALGDTGRQHGNRVVRSVGFYHSARRLWGLTEDRPECFILAAAA